MISEIYTKHTMITYKQDSSKNSRIILSANKTFYEFCHTEAQGQKLGNLWLDEPIVLTTQYTRCFTRLHPV